MSPAKVAGEAVTVGSVALALIASGWGLVALAGMVFVLCLLILCVPRVNDQFCRAVAALKARPSEPPVLPPTTCPPAVEAGREPQDVNPPVGPRDATPDGV